MKHHLRILATAIIAISALATTLTPAATAAEKSVGLRTGYTTVNDSPVAGLYFQYRFSKFLRVKPAIDYYFRHNGNDAFAFNLNAEVPIGVAGKFNVFPLAGVNVTSWNLRKQDSITGDDSSSRLTRFGINIGAGAEYYITKSLKLTVEAKYGWIRHYDGGNFTAAIGYVF